VFRGIARGPHCFQGHFSGDPVLKAEDRSPDYQRDQRRRLPKSNRKDDARRRAAEILGPLFAGFRPISHGNIDCDMHAV
jgi:hypothetical protein